MKTIIFFFLAFCLAEVGAQAGLLTEAQLQEAVDKNQCSTLASRLDSLEFSSERMKLNAAICLYRNGQEQQALSIFKSLEQQQGQFWRGAAFWIAKIYAARKQDSLAMASLLALPQGFLTYKMVSQFEFDHLAVSNDTFIALKHELKPKFTFWTFLLSLVAFIGLVISLVLVLGKSRFSAGEKWLALFVFSFVLILVTYLTIWTGYVIYFPYLRSQWPFFTLLVGPSLYFYLRESFKEEYTRREVMLHFSIPGVVFLLTLPALLSDVGLHMQGMNDLVSIGSSSILLTAHILFYTILIHFITQNEWQVDANIRTWSRILAIGMKIYSFAFLSYFILVNCSFFNPQWDYAISLVMGLVILVIAYMGLLQKRVFSSEPIERIFSVQKYRSSSLTKGASEAIKLKLERMLTEEQVFKENELRLDDLAAYLNINRHQLSQVINEHYKVNFFELLNKYRVAYVMRMLADPAYANYTIIQIAYEAGFNNKASFNRYFKSEVGLTPSAYRIKESVIHQ